LALCAADDERASCRVDDFGRYDGVATALPAIGDEVELECALAPDGAFSLRELESETAEFELDEQEDDDEDDESDRD
jgi:hypothetical protein